MNAILSLIYRRRQTCRRWRSLTKKQWWTLTWTSSSCRTKDGASENPSRMVRCLGSLPTSSRSCGTTAGFRT